MTTERAFTKSGTSRADLEAAWPARLADAEAALAAGRNALAITSALYAVEIRLKVLVCKRLDLEYLPKAFEIHDLDSLLLLAGLSRRILRKSAAEARENWAAIVKQSEELNDLRYTADQNWSHAQADSLIRRIKDPPHGVLLWLSKHR
jgi:hypothetical protein